MNFIDRIENDMMSNVQCGLPRNKTLVDTRSLEELIYHFKSMDNIDRVLYHHPDVIQRFVDCIHCISHERSTDELTLIFMQELNSILRKKEITNRKSNIR
jgi:hypothetical protein